MHLLRHSIELFFKGAIYLISDKEVQDTHDLEELRNRYRTLLPAEEFNFEILFKIEAHDSTGKKDSSFINQWHRTLDQRYRYPTGKNGTPFYGEEFSGSIYPRALSTDIEKLSNSLQRIENKLRIYKVNHNKL